MKTISIKTKLPGPKAKKLIAMDEKYTSPHYSRYIPLAIDSAHMATVTDVDGNKFLDFTAGIAVASCGHSHPDVVKAIKDQSDKLIHMCSGDYYNEPIALLSKKLCELWPGKTPAKVFLTNSGTEAVEGAIKLARYCTRRPRMISFLGAFHGRTMGSLSLTASKYLQRKGFGAGLAGVDHCPYGDMKHLKRMFQTTTPPDDVAAIFVEPLQGEGGYLPAPEGFLQELRDVCNIHGILMVADEIQSGFGRTGKMFCIEHDKVVPDVICMAKGIANGMPLGGVMAKANLMNMLESGCHGSTYAGNSVACAAALKSIQLIESYYMKEAELSGNYLMSLLEHLRTERPNFIKDIRGRGLMVGIEIRAADRPCPNLRDLVVINAFKRGLILLGCGESTIRLCPPLCVSPFQVEEAYEVIKEALEVSIKQHKL